MAAAVLLPASFVAFRAERFFLAVADRLDAAGTDGSGCERILHRRGALVAESQVVLRRPALVAVSLNRDIDVGMLVQEHYVGLNRALLVGANVRLVIIEVNVLHALGEQFLFRRSGGNRRWWRRLRYSNARCSLLRAP